MYAPPPGGPPPTPPRPPKPGSLPPPTGLSSKLTSVEDEPDDPTRMMARHAPRPAAGQRAVDHAAIFNAPTKIIPRVRSGGVLRSIGANLVSYSQRPSVNLALLLVAGALLVGLGFVLGSAHRESRDAAPSGASTINMAAPESTALHVASPVATTPTPVAAIAVSSLPLAPPLAPARDPNASGRSSAGSSTAHAPSADFALQPDRPTVVDTGESKKGYVAPIRNPGF